MHLIKASSRGYEKAFAELTQLLGAERKISAGVRNAELESVNAVNMVKGRQYEWLTPVQELIYMDITQCLVSGPLSNYLKSIVGSKGVPSDYHADTCREIAGTFIRSLPCLKNFDQPGSVRAYLQKTASTICRSFRERELRFCPDQAEGSAAVQIPGLRIQRLRPIGRGAIQPEALHQLGRLFESDLSTLRKSARVPVALPWGAKPRYMYLLPELTQHLHSLRIESRHAILLHVCGYSTKDGARLMSCTCAQFKVLLGNGVRQLSTLAELESDEMIRTRPTRHVEPSAKEEDNVGRVRVELPAGANPGYIYLLPEFAQHLASLKIEHKHAILLRTCGYSTSESAEILECTCGRFKVLLRGARLQLRSSLAAYRRRPCAPLPSVDRTTLAETLLIHSIPVSAEGTVAQRTGGTSVAVITQ